MLLVKKLLYKMLNNLASLNQRGRVAQDRVSVVLANTNIMQIVGGDVEVYQLDASYYLAFITLTVKYTASRATNMPAWKLQVDGADLTVHFPYALPSLIDGSNAAYFSFENASAPYWPNPTAVSANQNVRWTGVVLYRN